MPAKMLMLGTCLYACAAPLKIGWANGGWSLAALGLAVLLVREHKLPDLRLDGMEKVLLAYLAVGLVCAALGTDYMASARRLHSDGTHVLVAFVFAAVFAVRPVPEALPAAALGFATAGLFGIGQVAYYWFNEHFLVMARGNYHHITYGEMMVFGSTGAIAALLHSQKDPLPRRAALAACLALTLAGLLLSQSRGPWLGFAAAVVVIGLLVKAARPWLLGGLGAGLVALAAVPRLGAALHDRFLSIFDVTQNANAVRLQLWQVALKTFHEHPLTGSGPGTFRSMVELHHPEPLDGGVAYSQAHNMYLHVLAERGVVGLAMFLALMGGLTWTAARRYRRHPDLAGLWLVAAVAAFWVMNLTQNTFQTATPAMFLLFLFVYTLRHETA